MDTNNATATNNSMISFLDNYWNQEANIKNSTAAAEQQNRINTSLWFYEQSYNPTSWIDLRNQQHNASRAWKLASMIVQYWADNGVTVTWTDAEIINNYIANLPEQVRWTVASRFADYTHATEYMEDSKEFALEMWWRKNEWYDDVWDGIKWVAEYLWYGPYKLARWIRKIEDMGNAALDPNNNQKSLDVMNLANERYWFLAWLDGYLSDEDWEDLQWEVDNMQQSVDKQHNLANIAMDMWIWTVLTAANLTWLWATINLWVWVASQLPITKDILERANEVAWDIWTWVNKYMPWLSQYRDALWDEESKTEFDYFVGNMIVWALLWAAWKYRWLPKKWFKRLWEWKKWWNWWAWTPKEVVKTVKDSIKNVTSDDIIKAFEETKGKEIAAKEEILDRFIWEDLKKALKKEWYEYKAIEDSFDRLDIEWIKNSKWLVKRITEQKNKNIKDVNDILKLWLESDKLPIWKDNILDWTKSKTWKSFDFIEEELKLLKSIEEENIIDGSTSDNLKYLDNFSKKYKEWKITENDIIELQRYASREVSLYKNRAWEYNTEMKWNTAEKIRQAREYAIDFVKDRLNSSWEWRWDLFSDIEKAIHNDIIAEEYMKNREINRRVKLSKDSYRWDWKSIWSKTKIAASKVFGKWLKPWVKDTILNIWKRLLQLWDMDILWFDELTEEMLHNYDFLNEAIGTKKKVNAFKEKINKLKSIKEKIVNNKLKELEKPNWSNTPKQEPILDLSNLQYEYSQTLSEILEDLWAEKSDANTVVNSIQKSLFDI